MAQHRFCYCLPEPIQAGGLGYNGSVIAELYVNGARKKGFKYVHEFLNAMSEEGFELIQHAVGQLCSSTSHHYHTFRKD